MLRAFFTNGKVIPNDHRFNSSAVITIDYDSGYYLDNYYRTRFNISLKMAGFYLVFSPEGQQFKGLSEVYEYYNRKRYAKIL